ncbi:MAG: hypothetical protein JNM63_18425 [Spirochaetia bacterium]|nr:hypothetical protein [Spirochaetia bacterium]
MGQISQRIKSGEDFSELIQDLAPCVLDLDLGTYLKAYEVFGRLVDAGASLEDALPQLVERAQDYYSSGQQVRWILLRWVEKETSNADSIFAEVERALIRPKNLKSEDWPAWVLQLDALRKKSIVAQTLTWKSYGVRIGSGELSWFAEGSGGYSQTYLEFLANGPKGLWIDRAMPEATRVKIYKILGADAPVVKQIPEKLAEVEKVFADWEKKLGRGSAECAACKPARDLLVFESGTVQGCESCGQLYLHTVEHYHDVLEPNQDIELVRKYDFDEMQKLVLSHVGENEAYEIKGEV